MRHMPLRQRPAMTLTTFLLTSLAASPAFAQTQMPPLPWVVFSGANCSSDLPTVLTSNGTLENRGVKAPQPPPGGVTVKDYATFDCAVNVPSPYSSDTLKLDVLVMGQGTTRTDKLSTCTLSTTAPVVSTSTYTSDTATLPATSAMTLAVLSVGLPPQTWGFGGLASAHLRCKLYNTDTSPRGGITAYRVLIRP